MSSYFKKAGIICFERSGDGKTIFIAITNPVAWGKALGTFIDHNPFRIKIDEFGTELVIYNYGDWTSTYNNEIDIGLFPDSDRRSPLDYVLNIMKTTNQERVMPWDLF